MSATLHPSEFYRDLFGLEPERSVDMKYNSTFPPEHRAAYILPQVSTAYRHRERDREATAKLISESVKSIPGNTAVFFPSFVFLKTMLPLLSLDDRNVLIQNRVMDESQRQALLDSMRNENRQVLLGVLGGIFSEGIDLPGEALSCVIVVGPSLPQANLAQSWYEERYGQGFRYAWLVPGMSRVAQAAGRVIRGPEDCGAVILIGRRFLGQEYLNFLPTDWSVRPADNIAAELDAFWGAL